MKKIIFIFIILLTSGCSVATSLVGDITAYTLNGDVLGKWENVTIGENYNDVTTSSSFKTFGTNFYDSKNGKYIILSNAIPHIIEYKVKAQNSYTNPVVLNQSNWEERQIVKDKLITEYRLLDNKKDEIRQELKKYDKGTIEYQNTRKLYLSIVERMNKIEYTLQTNYFYYIR